MGPAVPQPHLFPPPAVPLMLPSLRTCVAAMHPDSLPIVLALAPHHIVGEVRLCHLMLRVHNHLGRVKGSAAVPGRAVACMVGRRAAPQCIG